MFSKLSRLSQLRLVRQAAHHAATVFGIQVAQLSLVNYGFNATYKVSDPGGRVYALRISINSKKTHENVLAEVQFMAHASRQAQLICPEPISTPSGEQIVRVAIAESDSEHFALMYPWISGRVLGDAPSKRQLVSLGATMAQLHEAVEAWVPTSPATQVAIGDPFQGQPNHILSGDPRLTKGLLDVVSVCLPMAESVFAELSRRTSPKTIHGDLHTGNVVSTVGRLGILDFDDFGEGYELQDLAIALFYLRNRDDEGQPLLEGYESVRPLPEHSSDELEALIAARSMMLLSDLIVNQTADLQEFLPTYVERTEYRLRRFLESGRFSLAYQ